MNKLSRRSLLGGAVAFPFVARAQSSDVIKIINPFAPGGSVDTLSRNLLPGIQQRLGATVVIENKGGASGSIGAALAAKAAPDGKTWLFVADTHALNPALIPNLPFDSVKDLDPVLLIGTAPNLVAKHPSRPYTSFTDVVAAAKEKPGTISYGTIGTGSVGNLGMIVLAKRAGIRLIHAPYRGGGPALNDAVAGHIDLISASPALLSPQLKSGGLKGLLCMGRKRLATLPDVPTAIESGFPNFEVYTWFGVFAPAGTPRALVEQFAAAVRDAAHEERAARVLTEGQQIELKLGGPEELRVFFAEQMKRWGDVIRGEGIKGDS